MATEFIPTTCNQCGHTHYRKGYGGGCIYEWCTCEKWTQYRAGNARTGPYKFTRDIQAAYCEKLKEGVGRVKAAGEIGIDIKTVEREADKGGVFLQERNTAETHATDEVEEALYGAAVSGNVPAAVKWLETKRPEVWAPKKDPLPGSSPATPLYVAPGQIDWDAIPDDLAEEFLALNAKLLALQPNSGGLVIDQNGATQE